MLQVFKKHQWLSSCTGIEIHILPGGTYSFRLCTIAVHEKELTIENRFETTEIGEILKKLDKTQPLALTITGRGILIKKANNPGEADGTNLNKLFPNLKADQFYVQIFDSNLNSWVAIIRKEVADGLMSLFIDQGLKVLHVGVGPFAVTHILKQLNSYGNELVFNGHQIRISEGTNWRDYQYIEGSAAEFPLKLGIEPIKEELLLAYSAAFQLALYDVLPVTGLQGHPAEETLMEYKEEQKFKFRGMSILGGLFVALILNFLLFQYYQEKNEQLISAVNRTTSSAEQLMKQEMLVNSNLTILKDLGWNKGISLAWLADQIGQTVPANLKLTEVYFNPPQHIKYQQDDYQVGLIRIVGNTKELKNINSWIYKLQEEQWVKQVKLERFSVADEDGKQSFQLLINY